MLKRYIIMLGFASTLFNPMTGGACGDTYDPIITVTENASTKTELEKAEEELVVMLNAFQLITGCRPPSDDDVVAPRTAAVERISSQIEKIKRLRREEEDRRK